MKRRDFIRNSAAGAGALLLSRYASPFAGGEISPAADSRIEVLIGEPLGVISPNIYGHFTENLSGVIYDGVWVGANSKIPNVNGIRKELIDEMKKIKPPVVRFPGGCFADGYDWRDGVGPIDRRPRRTNFWAEWETSAAPSSHRYDPNQFGRTSPPTSAVCPPNNFIAGSNTVIRPPAAPLWPTSALKRAIPIPLRLNIGESETNPGAAAEILLRKSMRPNSADTRLGFHSINRNLPSSHRVRTPTIGTGREDSSKKCFAREKSSCATFTAGRCITTRGI
jgi:hypothetical protein